jgi:hypothetical protein
VRSFLEANPHVDAVVRTEADLQRALERRKAEVLAKYPELASSGALDKRLAQPKGVPVTVDEMLKSSVYDPRDVPVRKSKGEVRRQGPAAAPTLQPSASCASPLQAKARAGAYGACRPPAALLPPAPTGVRADPLDHEPVRRRGL